MERLTRKETIVVRGKETAACNYKNDDCDDRCRYGVCRWQEKANMLLKEYEDTGLAPEEIRELKERDTAKNPDIIGVDKDEFRIGRCPKCGVMPRSYMRFCPNCGQRLKWEGRHEGIRR